MAIAGVCITFISCKDNSIIYYQTYNTDIMTLISDIGIGGIVQINDPANFPDTYYTLDSYCNVFNPGCDSCTNPENNVINDLQGVLFSYWISYGIECPQNDPLTSAYVLVNCLADIVVNEPEDLEQSPDTALVTSTDLSLYVGMVVNIAEYPGKCYTVLGPYDQDTGCPCDEVTITEGFADCECCLPPPPPPTCCEIPKYTQKPVKNYFRITDSDCEIKANTTFANNYYKLFMGIKYGVQNCCGDVDFEKLWLRKELSDYNKMNPPGFCTPPEDTICPEPCPEP